MADSSRRTWRFIVAEPLDPAAIQRLMEGGQVSELNSTSPDALIHAIADADALLIRSRTHVTARVMESAPKLKAIGRVGSGVDHIDLRVAQRRGIRVVYAPHAGTRSLSEFTLAMILASHRKLLSLDRRLRAGAFEELREPSVLDLSRMTLGLLGWTEVAEVVARILHDAFGATVLLWDPDARRPAEPHVEVVDLPDLLSRSDIVSLHLSLTPATRNLLSAERLASLKSTAVLVNTARGGLVDSAALAEMLKTGRLAGAAVDVFETEPLPQNHPLRNAPNCILTPHIGSITREIQDVQCEVVDDVMRVLRGEDPLHPAPMPPVSDGDAAKPRS